MNKIYKLLHLMKKISERCYVAQWMDSLEYVLWDCATRETGRNYGHDTITDKEAKQLYLLALECNGWWMFYDNKEDKGNLVIYEVFVPLPDWREYYKEVMK